MKRFLVIMLSVLMILSLSLFAFADFANPAGSGSDPENSGVDQGEDPLILTTGGDETGEDGTGEDGTGEDGTGEDGTGEDGTGEDGTGEDGTGEDGTGEDGTGEDGTGEDGTDEDGTGEDGTGEDGTGEDGTGEDETGEDGTGEDGTGEDGTGEDGTGEDGTGEDGTITPVIDSADTGTGKGEPSDYVLSITHTDVDEVTVYDWDVDAEFTEDAFIATAERDIESYLMNVEIDAEVDGAFTFDEVRIQLGNIVEDVFTAVYEFNATPAYQSINEGISNFGLDLEIDLLEYTELVTKLRVLVPVSTANNGSIQYIDDNISIYSEEREGFSEEFLNDDVDMETDVIDVFASYPGIVEVATDDWYITESDLDEDDSFTGIIPLDLEGFVDQSEIQVYVEIINANDVVLDDLLLSMIGEEIILPPQYAWNGGVVTGKGYWLPPVNGDFTLERKATQIKFWVDGSVREKVSINIYEAETDDEGLQIVGDLVKKIPSSEIVSKNCGKFSRLDEATMSGSYYKFKLKAKVMEELLEGNSYIMALMVGDSVLAFDESTLATLMFKVAEGSKTKGGMKDTLGNSPKRLDSNRALIKD